MQKRYEIVIVVISLIFTGACSILEIEDTGDNINSKIDFNYGIAESGKIRKELHFNNSDDYLVQSEFLYLYKNEKIVGKIFTDYNSLQPAVMQKDTFMYNGEKLLKQLQLVRETKTEGLRISKTYKFDYPNANISTKLVLNRSGGIEDSIVYVYEGDLVISETHITPKGRTGFNFEYNSSSKLAAVTDLNGNKVYENQYDANGLLSKTLNFQEGKLSSTITFERISKGERLSIKKYIQKADGTEKLLNSEKVFESGRLVELNEFATAQCGAIWWCTRYQYH